jgi:hypothetical protein
MISNPSLGTQPMEEPKDRLAKMEADIEELGYSFDAHLAITTAAALDGRLEKLLITEMTPINRELKDRLFTGYGALSGFAAKIEYMMKIGDLNGELVYGYQLTKNPDNPQIAKAKVEV